MTLVSTASKAATPFNGGTITTPLDIAPSNHALVPLTLVSGNDNTVHLLDASSAFTTAYLDEYGALNITGTGRPQLALVGSAAGSDPQASVTTGKAAGASATMDAGDGYELTAVGVADVGYLLRTAAFATLFRAGITALKFAYHAAPADGDLAAGECALWFDQTNGVGATKLMVKGKSADGTVKTAAIVLA